ncbi:MAG: hypothetical protein GXO09_05970 [Crenarchaeota archaeon]|nr:hypothetical protein [Thermoproteota archaeon]
MDGSRQEQPRILSIKRLGEDTYEIVLEKPGGETERIEVRIDEDGFIETPYGVYHIDDLTALAQVEEEAEERGVEDWATLYTPSTGEIKAKISMKIVEVYKKPGEEVREGEKIILFETMKMLGEVKAPCTGRITSLNVTAGQGVKPGTSIAVLECRQR